MNGKCFEIGLIQAFLDGETTPEISLRLTDHVSGCDACARLMAEADEQNSIVFSTLERELNSLVPTQRLWLRINETIEVEKTHAPVWQKAFAYLRISLLSPSIAGMAGIVLVVGMFAIFLTSREDALLISDPVPGGTVTSLQPETGSVTTTSSSGATIPGTTSASPSIKGSNLNSGDIRTLAASLRSGQREIKAQAALYTGPAAVDNYLPGEESYVKTISDLRQNVDSQKDAVMTPSSRVSYERDMAMVNDSIKRMRDAVKKNPRNQAARQVLYSSYQDKIDLLNSVAQREELMASLR